METRRQPVEDRFRLCSRKLHIGDFQQITDYLYAKTQGIETPLFKHHKTPNELAYILYDFYQKGLLYVYVLKFAIQDMERKARENGCIMNCTGSSMVEKTKEVTNLYTKQGYEVYGVSFLKELR